MYKTWMDEPFPSEGLCQRSCKWCVSLWQVGSDKISKGFPVHKSISKDGKDNYHPVHKSITEHGKDNYNIQFTKSCGCRLVHMGNRPGK